MTSRRGEPIRRVTLGDGSIRYEVIIDVGRPDGRRKQSRTRYRTLREAKAALAKARVGIADGTFVSRSAMTVKSYLDGWVEGKIDLRSSTRQSYRSDLKVVIAKYGDLPLQRLTKKHIDELVGEMRGSGGRTGDGRSARTVTLMLVVLSQALTAAVRERLVTVNVAALVNRPGASPVVLKKTWTADQARQFLTHVADDRLAAAWRLTMLGLRRGEVLGLRWADLDLEQGTARIERARVLDGNDVVVNDPKTSRGVRTIYLPSEVLRDLKTLRRLQAEERLAVGAGYPSEGWIVVDQAGRPLRPAFYSNAFARHLEAAGLPRIRLHDARHTAASLLAQERVEIGVAAALLGHDPVVYLQTYVHPYEDAKRAASEQLAATYR